MENTTVFKYKIEDKVVIHASKIEGSVVACSYEYKITKDGEVKVIQYSVNLGSHNRTVSEDEIRRTGELPFKQQLELYEKMINANLGENDEAVVYYNDLKNKLIAENEKGKKK